MPALLLSVSSVLACGPWFPNNMLDRGDAAVLAAPVANFYRELDRMQIPTPQFAAVLSSTPVVFSSNSYSDETLQTELADLREALKKSGKSTNDIEQIVTAHLAERTKLQQFIDAYAAWKDSAPMDWDNGEAHRGTPAEPQPTFPSINIVDGLPGEFADYFEGAIAWNSPSGNKAGARESWERLLNRPANERHYKSTWAAFMLGRSWDSEDPQKARDYYKQVRSLVAQGFSDPTGLAAAAIGWEARLALRANEFQTAIDLYLQQYAANGWGSGESLQVALGRAIEGGPKALAPLALKQQTRKLVTAYLISQKPNEGREYDGSPSKALRENIKAWLDAVEQADVKDVESAEQFALAAYQADDMELALRWVNRAGHTPTAQWLQAKLLLRAGRVAQATELLSQIVDSFPLDELTNDIPPAEASFASGLSVPDDSEYETVPASRYIRGELGALRLSRREYTQSLDLLFRGDFRSDAAYIADRVLTTDELKAYVDENWPALAPVDDENKSEDETSLEHLTSDIRYLLARRLARENHGNEARPYYPTEQVPDFDRFMGALATGWDESLAADERAKALAAAAVIARDNGMELLGTDAEPDWHLFDGGCQGVTVDTRTNQDATAVIASADELKRYTESKPDPDKRYHYRYQAASLAWEASKLMPNNSEETARLLCRAGSWLKAQDPDTADIFYKTLVRRCRKTDIGAEADLIRWFPDFDSDGNVVRTRLERLDLPTPQEINSDEALADYPIPGKHFIVQSGDHIRYIAAAVQRLGISMTAKDIFAANPDIPRNEDITGREILIPLPGAVTQPITQPTNPDQPAPP